MKNITGKTIKISSSDKVDVYRVPADVVYAVIFAGTLSNSSIMRDVQFVTVEHLSVDNVSTTLVRETPVPNGISVAVPKIAMKPGETITAQAKDTGTNIGVDIMLSVIEVREDTE